MPGRHRAPVSSGDPVFYRQLVLKTACGLLRSFGPRACAVYLQAVAPKLAPDQSEPRHRAPL
jgi:hypothetical protein